LYYWEEVIDNSSPNWWCEPLDFQILQKVLPKIGGDVQRVGDVIDRLIRVLIDVEIDNKDYSELFKEWRTTEDGVDKVKSIKELKINKENALEQCVKALREKEFMKEAQYREKCASDEGKKLLCFPFLRSLYKLLRMKERLEKFGTTSFYEY